MRYQYEGEIRSCLLYSNPIVHVYRRPVPDRLHFHALAMLSTWREGEPLGSEIHRVRAKAYKDLIHEATWRHQTPVEEVAVSRERTPDGGLWITVAHWITASDYALLLHQERADAPPLIATWFEMHSVPWLPVVADDRPLTWGDVVKQRLAAIGKRERWTDRQIEAARHEFEQRGGNKRGRKTKVAGAMADELGISRQAFLRSIGIDSRTPGVTSDTRRPSNQAHRMGASTRPRRIR